MSGQMYLLIREWSKAKINVLGLPSVSTRLNFQTECLLKVLNRFFKLMISFHSVSYFKVLVFSYENGKLNVALRFYFHHYEICRFFLRVSCYLPQNAQSHESKAHSMFNFCFMFVQFTVFCYSSYENVIIFAFFIYATNYLAFISNHM